jgi:hypothetical protein
MSLCVPETVSFPFFQTRKIELYICILLEPIIFADDTSVIISSEIFMIPVEYQA